MNVLVTGGCGYIGSHTCVELIENGMEPIVVDNLSNSKEEVLNRIYKITGKKIKFYKGDVSDTNLLRNIFKENDIDSVIHFAGLKSVTESCDLPLEYYQNNIVSTLSLLNVMKEFNCKNIIFSSSASVYGKQEVQPIREDATLSEPSNAYARTKLFIEYILKDLYNSDKEWNIVLLRYFNPVGAHESGLIGEDPNGIPNNLCPYVTQVAIGKLPYLKVTGNDYNTIDGTGVRDYIHVCDLAYGHVLCLQKITKPGLHIYNLGTGTGYSVLQVVSAFERACGKQIPCKFAPRRPGDFATVYANCDKAKTELGFECKKDLNTMAKDAWNFQVHNPNGIN